MAWNGLLSGMDEQRASNDQSGLARLQQATGAVSLAGKLQEMQTHAQMRDALSKGASPDQIIQSLIASGNVAGAHQAAQTFNEMAKMKAISEFGGSGGSDFASMTPDQLRSKAMQLTLIHPEGSAGLFRAAQQKQDMLAGQDQLPMLQSQRQPITAAPAVGSDGIARSQIPAGGPMVQPPGATEPIPQQVAQQAEAGAPFSTGVGPSAVPADNTQKVGGMFSALAQSQNPATRQEAMRLTAFVNRLTPATATPAMIAHLEKRAEAMATGESNAANQRAIMAIAQGNRIEAKAAPGPETNKPMTDLGKLNADLEAGRITKAQFDAGSASKAPTLNSAGTLTGDALREAAVRYSTDGTLPTNLGRGAQGAMNTVKILQSAADYNKELGNAPEASRIQQLANKANSGALNDLVKRESQVSAFEKTFVSNTQLVESLSDRSDRTGVPLVNRWLNAGKRSITGDTDLVAFDAALKGAVNEYTKIVSGSMGNAAMAESEVKKIESLLSAAQTPEQVKSVLNTMRTETQNRMKGFSDQKVELMNNFRAVGQRSADKTGGMPDMSAIDAEIARRRGSK